MEEVAVEDDGLGRSLESSGSVVKVVVVDVVVVVVVGVVVGVDVSFID